MQVDADEEDQRRHGEDHSSEKRRRMDYLGPRLNTWRETGAVGDLLCWPYVPQGTKRIK